MATQSILKGANAFLSFSIRDASRVLVNADTLPTVTGVQLGGAEIASTGINIIQQVDSTPAAKIGRYYVRVANTTTAGWADGTTGEVQLSATIGGLVVTEELKFVVRAATTNSPYIDVD